MTGPVSLPSPFGAAAVGDDWPTRRDLPSIPVASNWLDPDALADPRPVPLSPSRPRPLAAEAARLWVVVRMDADGAIRLERAFDEPSAAYAEVDRLRASVPEASFTVTMTKLVCSR